MARRRHDERGQRVGRGPIEPMRTLGSVHDAPRTVTDELLERAGRGDLGALASLYDRTAPTIYGLVCAAMADAGADARAAQQVTMQVYLDAWRAAPGFDPGHASALAVLLARACRCLAEFGDPPPVRRPTRGQPC